METKANYTLVGAFVVFSLVVIVSFILWVARVDFSRNATEYDAYFSGSVTGLKEGGTVLYRGVPVGSVKSIRLDPNNVERIKVTIILEGGVPIKEDAFASLEMQGITGVAYVQLNGGTSNSPSLKPKPGQHHAVIPTKSSVFEEVTASLPTVLHQISKTFEEIRPLFDEENRKAFGESLQSIHSITKALAPVPGQQSDLHDTLLSMKEGMKEFRSMVNEMKLVLADNRSSLSNFTATGLPALTQFLTEGKDALTTIRRVGDALERSPARFLNNDPRQGVKVP
ncbi:MAG: MlaD family protein [Alphaproteobacteria bacterium]|jgi:phospholipid/cholesterol/gamma-HCH transport system substrate-binding protein|nr:MlaD family protein [Alphaproteobacteria bacterium]